jgi:hypothetical protein
LLKEKLLKKKNDDLNSNPTTRDLLSHDLREIANNGVSLPILAKDDFDEKDYKALLKKQLDISQQERDFKKKVYSEQKSVQMMEESRQKKQLGKLAKEHIEDYKKQLTLQSKENAVLKQERDRQRLESTELKSLNKSRTSH